MKIITRFIAVTTLTGWVLSAHGNEIGTLLQVDFSDLSAVSISTTGKAPITDGLGTGTFYGISLLDFFTREFKYVDEAAGDLTANGVTAAYNGVQSAVENSHLNVWLGGLAKQRFATDTAAFTGSLTLDLSEYSDALRPLGASGAIVEQEQSTGKTVVIGQWAITGPVKDNRLAGARTSIPEPASFSLIVLSLVGLSAYRRKKTGVFAS